MQGTPTYKPTEYIIVAGSQTAMKLSKLLIGASTFHTVEPLPDDQWMFFVKEESKNLLKGFGILANARE